MSADADRLTEAAEDAWNETYANGTWFVTDRSAFILGFFKGATYQLKTPLTRVQMMLDDGSESPNCGPGCTEHRTCSPIREQIAHDLEAELHSSPLLDRVLMIVRGTYE